MRVPRAAPCNARASHPLVLALFAAEFEAGAATMVLNNQAFLKGKYIQVGLHEAGSFGTPKSGITDAGFISPATSAAWRCVITPFMFFCEW